MILGAILGIVIGSIISAVVYNILDDICYHEIIIGIGVILTLVIIIILGAYLGIYLDKIEYEKQVNTYIVTKQTIEDAIQNKDITGLEKLELLKQVNEQNEKLERLKVEVNQWYCFYLDKTKVENLEPIKLK